MSDCTACSGSFYLSANRCVNSCSSSQYFRDTESNTCRTCTLPCLTCDSNSGTTCLSCVLGFLSNRVCVTSCPVGQYGANATCRNCSTACLVCRPEEDLVICTKCNGTMAYYLKQTACVMDCGAGFYSYLDTINTEGLCLPCRPSCSNCLNAEFYCLTCPTGIPYLYMNRCYDAAPTGFYLDGNNITPCNSSCASCQGMGTNCTACFLGRYLSNNTCVVSCSTSM